MLNGMAVRSLAGVVVVVVVWGVAGCGSSGSVDVRGEFRELARASSPVFADRSDAELDAAAEVVCDDVGRRGPAAVVTHRDVLVGALGVDAEVATRLVAGAVAGYCPELA